jgi:hypothetical protein
MKRAKYIATFEDLVHLLNLDGDVLGVDVDLDRRRIRIHVSKVGEEIIDGMEAPLLKLL